MVMSGSYDPNNIFDFGQFNICSQNLVINFISWDVNSLLRDSCFLHIKISNPQGRKFNVNVKRQSIHTTSRKYLIYNVETKIGLNQCQIFWSHPPFPSSIEEFNSHDNTDYGQLVDIDYDVDLSLISFSCQSFPKGCFHDPMEFFLNNLINNDLHLMAYPWIRLIKYCMVVNLVFVVVEFSSNKAVKCVVPLWLHSLFLHVIAGVCVVFLFHCTIP